jgi:hypothetical protein
MTRRRRISSIVIPAKAGIHLSAARSIPVLHERCRAARWIPAFAGMTMLVGQDAPNA